MPTGELWRLRAPEGFTYQGTIRMLEWLMRERAQASGPALKARFNLVATILAAESHDTQVPFDLMRRERLRGAASWAADSVDPQDSSLMAISTLRLSADLLYRVGPY